jgi:hypothetical protein
MLPRFMKKLLGWRIEVKRSFDDPRLAGEVVPNGLLVAVPRQEPFDGTETRSADRHFVFGYRHQCDS